MLGSRIKCAGHSVRPSEAASAGLYKDVKLECGYRVDLLVDGRVVVELKAVESLAPIHDAIVLTYLRLSSCKIGLLINFNTAVLKDGIRRLVNGYEG